jgi:5-formyltetrahydrofolate cyclo-ligase
MTKQELRQVYLQKRQALTEGEYLLRNRKICELFFASIDISFAKTIHTFLPIREKHEPDTWLIIERIRREFPHVRISLPRITEAEQMENIYFEGLHQLIKNKWGIEEPRHGVPTPVEKIDLVLVPLLCFDERGNRVGYGKGYYDSFLKECRPSTKKIGLSLFNDREVIDDLYDGDIRLNECLTPDNHIIFSTP